MEHTDWCEKRVVPSMDDQGHGYHCIIFSSMSALDCAGYIRDAKWIKPSKQQALDQNPQKFIKGEAKRAKYFKWINGKEITAERNYPLHWVGDSLVKQTFNPLKVKLPSLTAHWKLVKGMDAMVEALKNGPIVGMMFADTKLQRHDGYHIFKNSTWKDGERNHTFLILGEGTCAGGDYWIVQFSWGADWGHKGRARILKGCNLRGIEIGAYVQFLRGQASLLDLAQS